MPKYISGRTKLRDPGKLTADRYRYLGLDQAEPNLGDPPDGTPPTGAIPSGERYQIVSIEGHPGERYWIPVEGGIIPGTITIYDEGTLVGGINSTSQLNFVGAAISASSINTFKETTLTLADSLTFSFTQGLGVTQKNSDAFGYVKESTTNSGIVTITNVTGSFTTNAADELFEDSVGIARTPVSKSAVINASVASSITVSPEFFSTNKELIFNDNGEFNGAGVYWDKSNARLGINSSDPAYTLDVNGSIKVGATIYDSDGDPGLQGNILVKGAGNPGTIDWVRLESIISGAGGTIGNIQFHGTTGLVSGDDEINFNPYNEFIGIGTNDPAQKFQVGLDGKRYTTKKLTLDSAIGANYSAGDLVQLRTAASPFELQDIFGTLVYDVPSAGTALTVRNSNYETKGTQWSSFTGSGYRIFFNNTLLATGRYITSVGNDATIPETTYAGDDVFVVTNTGKVAIGTPNPFGDMHLSIDGSASISAGSTFIIGDNVGITTHTSITGDDLIIETATPRLTLYSNTNEISEIKLLERATSTYSKYGAFIRYDGKSPDPDNYLVIGGYNNTSEYKLIDAHRQNNTSRSLNFYNNNDLKFEVNNNGAKVTGNIEVTSGTSDFQGDVKFDGQTAGYDVLWDKSEDSLTALDNAQFRVGTGGDVRIYHDATRSYFGIDSGSSGNLTIGGKNSTTGFHTAIHVNYTSSPESGGITTDFVNVELWHTSFPEDINAGTASSDGSKKFETIGAGVSVYDTAYIPNLITVGVATIDNIQIGHSDDNTINTKSGNLHLDSADGTVEVEDVLYVDDTTASTNTTTGALVVSGGAGIAGDLNVGGGATSQNLDVSGIATIATLGVSGVTTTKDLKVTGITTTKDLKVTGLATIATLGVTGLTTTKDLEVTGITTANDKEIYTKFDIENSGSSAYTFKSTGIGFTQNRDNPDIYLNRGQNYRFYVDASNHPFWIKTINSTGIGNSYNDGVVGNGATVGIVTFKVPFNSPDTLYYNCENHQAMNGRINIGGGSGGGGGNTDLQYTKGQFTVGAGAADIDSFDYSSYDYKTAEYILHFEDSAGNIQACKCFIMQNNTTSFIQEYAIMFDPYRIVNLTTTISGTDVKLQATPESGITGIVTYRFNRGTML